MHASYGPSCQDSGKIQTGSTDIQEYASYTRQGDRPGTGHRHSDTALRSERAAEKNEGVPHGTSFKGMGLAQNMINVTITAI